MVRRVHYAVTDCWLGTLVIARTERGICAILLGDEQELLLQDLSRRFATASLERVDLSSDRMLVQAAALVEHPGQQCCPPLDLQGTRFQLRVWRELREIPAGHTTSYAGIAARIGAPRAVRAVARACAANPLAVAVPCHRVLRTDGNIAGYRWGIERKQALLAREAAA
jgi:AraC family transcriptional regulator, regulatory protein of adaptative response / methylated-DNA-[protein]-cysteine methyltransferase